MNNPNEEFKFTVNCREAVCYKQGREWHGHFQDDHGMTIIESSKKGIRQAMTIHAFQNTYPLVYLVDLPQPVYYAFGKLTTDPSGKVSEIAGNALAYHAGKVLIGPQQLKALQAEPIPLISVTPYTAYDLLPLVQAASPSAS